MHDRRLSKLSPLSGLALAVSCFCVACSSDDSISPSGAGGTSGGAGTGGGAAGGIVDSGAPQEAGEPLPSSCTVPPLPTPLGQPHVVGDGSAASCTRAALQAAVAQGGDVSFNCGASPVTIAIDEQVEIPANTILDGKGVITLDGQGKSRILTAKSQVSVTVIGLTFTRGFGSGADGKVASGGAIRGGYQGAINVFDCTFTDNTAGAQGEEGGGALFTSSDSKMVIVRSTFQRNSGGSGGAVHNLLSPLTIVNSVFVDNHATNTTGGAVFTDGASAKIDDEVGGTIDICGCRFDNNTAREQGGGVYLFAYLLDKLIVNQCEFTSNSVANDGGEALGGGLRTGNAPLNLGNSLFHNNHADSHGGGLWVDGKYLTTIRNCTFLGNSAGINGKKGYGGAISGANFDLGNLTLVNNTAESGGAIYGQGSQDRLRNSILSNNTATNQWNINMTCRNEMAGDHNLQWPAPSKDDTLCTADVTSADPLLGELSAQGGPTWTIPLLTGSPAINAGSDCTETDQRGKPRSGPCDLGAFEVQ